MWKVEKIVRKGDYDYAVVRGQPNATKHGYVLAHRVVMENHLDRLLGPNEVVHHINGDKRDNSIENLEVMSVSDHARFHASEKGRMIVELRCPFCGLVFHRRKGNTHLVKNTTATFCSRVCNGSFSREKQLQGLTIQMESAISENIRRVYRLYKDNSEQTVWQRDA